MISKFFKRKKDSYYITFLTIIKKNQINLTVLRFFFSNTSQLYGSQHTVLHGRRETANSETVNSTRFARLPSNHSISNFHQMPQNVCPRVPECSTVVQATWSPSWKSPQVHILQSTCIATLNTPWLSARLCSRVQLRINFPSKTKFKLTFFSLSNSRTEGKIRLKYFV